MQSSNHSQRRWFGHSGELIGHFVRQLALQHGGGQLLLFRGALTIAAYRHSTKEDDHE